MVASKHVGDLASVVGLLISMIGFGATVVEVFKSRTAAQRAEAVARGARDSISLFETVADFADPIATLMG